jgi:glutamate racemase
LACNTASAKALRTIQQKDLPKLDPTKRVLGVIRPSAETVGAFSSSGHIGILATEGTVNSGSYEMELHKFFPDLKIVQHACPIWVPLIENNIFDTLPGKELIHEDVKQLLSKDPQLDVLLLGCTHYPLIQRIIEDLVGESIKVIPQGAIVAEKLSAYLKNHPELESSLSRTGKRTYLTTEQSEIFDVKASQFFGENIHSEHIHL